MNRTPTRTMKTTSDYPPVTEHRSGCDRRIVWPAPVLGFPVIGRCVNCGALERMPANNTHTSNREIS